jgi:hypothetical protein
LYFPFPEKSTANESASNFDGVPRVHDVLGVQIDHLFKPDGVDVDALVLFVVVQLYKYCEKE